MGQNDESETSILRIGLASNESLQSRHQSYDRTKRRTRILSDRFLLASKIVLALVILQLCICLVLISRLSIESHTSSRHIIESSNFNQLSRFRRIRSSGEFSRLKVLAQNAFQTAKLRPIKVPLIVGGSDGSGTRSFVEILARLGVPMLLDDPKTLDIGGSMLCHRQGWPPLAKIALNYKSLPVDLWPADVQNKSEFEFSKLRRNLESRFKRQQGKLMSHPHLHFIRSQLATKVLFGFKAPITMLLLPMIQAHLFPKGFKFLHVIRDGRDIALSSNQSPVSKFYNFTYSDATYRIEKYRNMTPVLAMHLWNDWNIDLYEWAKHEMSKQKDQSPIATFDYLLVRSEDFLNKETRLTAIKKLAEFVGSPLGADALCCLSKREAQDLGQSATLYSMQNASAIKHLSTNSVPADHAGSTVRSVRSMPLGSQSEGTQRRRLLNDNTVQMLNLELLERRPGEINRLKIYGDSSASKHHRLTGNTSEWFERSNRTTLVSDSHHFHRKNITRKKIELDYGDTNLGVLMASQLKSLQSLKNTSLVNVTERYGKWSTLIMRNSSLWHALHQEGAKALKLFGYSPKLNFFEVESQNYESCSKALRCLPFARDIPTFPKRKIVAKPI